MLNICITFDYELFLEKNNAPYKEILFAPTDNLIKNIIRKRRKWNFLCRRLFGGCASSVGK